MKIYSFILDNKIYTIFANKYKEANKRIYFYDEQDKIIFIAHYDILSTLKMEEI